VFVCAFIIPTPRLTLRNRAYSSEIIAIACARLINDCICFQPKTSLGGVARGQFSLIPTHRPCLECTHTLTLYMYCSYILHTYEHVVQTFYPSSPRNFFFCLGLSLSSTRTIANILTHMMIHTNAIIHMYMRTQMRTHLRTGMHIVEYIGTHTHTYLYTYSVLESHQEQTNQTNTY